MEITETITHAFYLLENGYYIDEIDVGGNKDYWLAKEGSEKKQFLGSNKSAAFEKAKQIIG